MINIDTWPLWFIGAVGVYFLSWGISERVREKYIDRHEQACRQALKVYVRTGRKSKAFHTATRSAIATAERTRLRYIEELRRERENKAIDLGFQAICECPKCQSVDLHWLTGNMAGRQCKACGYTWHVPV